MSSSNEPTTPPIIAADRLAKAERTPRADFVPLDQVTTPTVTTAEAAFYLSRKPQTLLVWSMGQTGPLKPRKIFGRLAWPTAALKKLLGV